MSHVCDAAIVCCIDFRFQKFIRDWTDQNLKGKTFDLIGFAGATKDLETIMGQLDISVRLHHIKQVVLIHHEECGAYGAESTPERHAQDLQKAKAAILAKYPDLQIDLHYFYLNGKFEAI
ncbi:hypothetical protein A2160_03640 [Candidatus Beckwithbacteria bacterium RBG_13_42_9]|uniref:Carbonic anhydrase n=1 Tax=Candidatus Beckwithbacteria bacterium RBG_13_42_9 TaxID=1797457 RepID=A0A1F5E8L9_9BACT|nr:MAG: hypothetical protein A2160_03640 [Candidatus Beckwithbacteria bacterium RBG_13_42_9]